MGVTWEVTSVSAPDPTLSHDWGADGEETNLAIYVTGGSITLTTTDGSPRIGGSGGQTSQRTISGPYRILGAHLRSASIVGASGSPVVTVVASWPEVDDPELFSLAASQGTSDVNIKSQAANLALEVGGNLAAIKTQLANLTFDGLGNLNVKTH